ncbi:hypothetical protein ACHAW6_000634, partial [Cyclotella cf. meneghiniana]
RAIQTFKSHFIAILSGVANSFPINEWDSLLPQAILTLNFLRNSNVAPKISAHAYHQGLFDYDRMPLAPIGCEVQFHVKPGHRRTWGKHSTDGWCIGASNTTGQIAYLLKPLAPTAYWKRCILSTNTSLNPLSPRLMLS